MVALNAVAIPIHKYQAAVIQSRAWLTGFVGGRGAGKTRLGPHWIHQRAKPGDIYTVISPDAVVVHQTTFPTFIEVGEQAGWLVDSKKTPYPTVFMQTKYGGTAEVNFRGAEKPDKLRGPNNAGIWFDEASIISSASQQIAIARCRWRGKMAPVLATFTPRGFAHWTFEEFFLRDMEAEESGLEDDGLFWFADRAYRLKPKRNIVHCRSRDNPFLSDEYEETIGGSYSSVLRMQELGGEFVEIAGLIFKREWFEMVDVVPIVADRIRYWDRAYLPGDGCYTAGVLLARAQDGIFYVEDVQRGQWGPMERNQIIRQTAEADARRYHGSVRIYIEHEGSGASKESLQNIIRELPEFPVYGDTAALSASYKIAGGVKLPGDAKIRRALPLAAHAEAKEVRVKKASWMPDFLDELAQFPESKHCDQVDAVSAAYRLLANMPRGDTSASRLSVRSDTAARFGKLAEVGGDAEATAIQTTRARLPWNRKEISSEQTE